MKTYSVIKTKKWYAYLMIFISAILFTFSIQAFIQVAKSFTSGVSSISLVPTLLIDDIGPYTTLIYLALNVPLLIIYWRRVKKDFIYKTTFFLVISAVFGLLFMINSVSDWTQHIVIKHPENVLDDVWPIFILSSLGGLFVGGSIAITWKFGGSSGGGDIITYYYSTKKKVSIGLASFFVSITFVLIAFVTTISIKEDLRASAFPILTSTILYVGISSVMINAIYPKYSKIHVEIHTSKISEVTKYLKKTKYPHSWQIVDFKSGYLNADRKMILTVMLLVEYKEIKNKLKEIDGDIWISATSVWSQIGKFNTFRVDQ